MVFVRELKDMQDEIWLSKERVVDRRSSRIGGSDTFPRHTILVHVFGGGSTLGDFMDEHWTRPVRHDPIRQSLVIPD